MKRIGKVYTKAIKNTSRAEIRPLIRQLVKKEGTIYTDKFSVYDGLIVNGYKHHRINHQKFRYSDFKGGHVNGIESFWSFAKRRMFKFNGIRDEDSCLHSKESEFRFNERRNIYNKLLNILKVI